MKKTLLILTLLVTLSNADYEIFQSQTKQLGNINKTEKIYFGKYDGFGKKLKEGTEGAMFQGLFGGLANGISGAGIGFVIGFMEPFVMSLQMDQKYLLVYRLEDSEGNIAFKKVMFIGARHGESYEEEEILKLMKDI
jgi:hypothetical protein